ncbi:RING finger protein 151 isoform X1 [Nycticebus coucang]|uniref:RING finger protein 151 isoform X1 n=1 Tax=Nycticebus coucang TaxID=9470 RepID=UPI00234DE968|nr:RING finger protein 151 isoform X1 [Nycticebus coucang]
MCVSLHSMVSFGPSPGAESSLYTSSCLLQETRPIGSPSKGWTRGDLPLPLRTLTLFMPPSRQKTCPCCRKEVKRKKMVHVNKLRKTIGRLEVKCKNAEAGCLVTCPLAHRKGHQDSCPFELMACPNEGCTAQVPRGTLGEHQQHCQQGVQQRCSLGCGATLGPAQRASHNCYRELREAWSQRQERSRVLLLHLLQRVRRVHRATSLVRRQLAQLSKFLEEDEALLMGAPQEAVEGAPEGSMGAEVWGTQG